MSAAGLALVGVGALLIYAGMTGGSLVKAVQQVLTGKGNSSGFGGSGGGGAWGAGDQTGDQTEAERDAAQTRRPAQP